MSVLEAWSYVLPVMITDSCNLPEGFEADAAIRIEPERDSIAGGLGQLMAMNEETLSGIGLRGRRLVEQSFSWPSIAERMASVYDWCLKGGEVPECVEIPDT